MASLVGIVKRKLWAAAAGAAHGQAALCCGAWAPAAESAAAAPRAALRAADSAAASPHVGLRRQLLLCRGLSSGFADLRAAGSPAVRRFGSFVAPHPEATGERDHQHQPPPPPVPAQAAVSVAEAQAEVRASAAAAARELRERLGKARPTVVVGVSGGVDSALAALLLKEEGLDVRGVFLKNWDESEESPDGRACSYEADRADARLVANHVGIDLEEVDFVKASPVTQRSLRRLLFVVSSLGILQTRLISPLTGATSPGVLERGVLSFPRGCRARADAQPRPGVQPGHQVRRLPPLGAGARGGRGGDGPLRADSAGGGRQARCPAGAPTMPFYRGNTLVLWLTVWASPLCVRAARGRGCCGALTTRRTRRISSPRSPAPLCTTCVTPAEDTSSPNSPLRRQPAHQN